MRAELNPAAGVDAVVVNDARLVRGEPITITRSEFERVNAIREGRPLLIEVASPSEDQDGDDIDPADHHQEDA